MRTAGEGHPKPKLLLATQHVLGSDGVALPHGLVEIFAIVSTKFRRKMIDEIEGMFFENALHLPMNAYIATQIIWACRVDTIRNPDLIATLL